MEEEIEVAIDTTSCEDVTMLDRFTIMLGLTKQWAAVEEQGPPAADAESVFVTEQSEK